VPIAKAATRAIVATRQLLPRRPSGLDRAISAYPLLFRADHNTRRCRSSSRPRADRLHRAALASAIRARRSWIWAELAANVAWIAFVFPAIDVGWLRYHVLAMAMGQCLTAFFAVWTVHHGCREHDVLARTIRRRINSVVTFSMFFHVEHHLFPQVPTAKLHLLARRLDRNAPEVSALRVF
jgi:fatty acid desaturase